MSFAMRAVQWASSPMRSDYCVARRGNSRRSRLGGLTPANDGGFIVISTSMASTPVLDRPEPAPGLKTLRAHRSPGVSGTSPAPIFITRVDTPV